MKFDGRHILVLGLGESGLAMARWLARRGAHLRVADSRATAPNAAALRQHVPAADVHCGAFSEALLSGIDLVALSPGVPAEEAIVRSAKAQGVKVVSEIELFAEGIRVSAPGSQVLAITGSNGKTTTTALTAELCRAAGRRAIACGNISPSALDALMAAEDAGDFPEFWVLELSSFQLEATESLAPLAATVLNISEDHLDRYADMAAYAAAKARIFKGARTVVINRDDAMVRAMADDMKSSGTQRVSFGLNAPASAEDFGLIDEWLVRGGTRVLKTSSMRMSGTHNVANAMAALALCEAAGITAGQLAEALSTFAGLPHRVEWIAQIDGVDYYDDSKGTNVGATLAALQGMGRKVSIILGGDGKGQDFSPLTEALRRHGRFVALIGRDAQAIAETIADAGVAMKFCADMDAAVAWCADAAQTGEVVLLSPACSSLDMYRNYGHRAEVFVAAVKALKAKSNCAPATPLTGRFGGAA